MSMILHHIGRKLNPGALQLGLTFHIISTMDKMDTAELHAMIAEYMEKGFLENIKDMLKHDPSLFSALPLMIADERIGTRIGVVALAEDMREEFPDELRAQIPAVAAHLSNENPTIRGDAVYLMSAIAHPDALPFLESHQDDHPAVRQMIVDTIEELKGSDE